MYEPVKYSKKFNITPKPFHFEGEYCLEFDGDSDYITDDSKWRIDCPHPDCPICKKDSIDRKKRAAREKKKLALKKRLYDKRCKE